MYNYIYIYYYFCVLYIILLYLYTHRDVRHNDTTNVYDQQPFAADHAHRTSFVSMRRAVDPRRINHYHRIFTVMCAHAAYLCLMLLLYDLYASNRGESHSRKNIAFYYAQTHTHTHTHLELGWFINYTPDPLFVPCNISIWFFRFRVQMFNVKTVRFR